MSARPQAGGPVALRSILPAADSGDRAFSVADAQQALRDLRVRQAQAQYDTGGDKAGERQVNRGDNAATQLRARGDVALRVAVVAGHPGAGSTTVALALGDAAADAGRSVHLIDPAAPGRSGLVQAAVTELGTDDSRAWQRGLRSIVVLDRRARSAGPEGAQLPGRPAARLTVLDLGFYESAEAVLSPVVVVFRPTVPGVRLAERRLDELGERPLIVAAVGPHGWAREVRASVGPRLAGLREVGRFVSVPLDARLEVTGLTDRPLSRPMLAAGAQLLAILDGMGGVGVAPSTTGDSAREQGLR